MRVICPLIILLAVVLGCDKDASDRTNAANRPAEKAAVSTPTPEPVKKSGVTMENFNKIKTGMRYADVVEILGQEGEVISESEVAGINTIMYQWSGGMLSNMNAMFQNGKLVNKAQFGLK